MRSDSIRCLIGQTAILVLKNSKTAVPMSGLELHSPATSIFAIEKALTDWRSTLDMN